MLLQLYLRMIESFLIVARHLAAQDPDVVAIKRDCTRAVDDFNNVHSVVYTGQAVPVFPKILCMGHFFLVRALAVLMYLRYAGSCRHRRLSHSRFWRRGVALLCSGRRGMWRCTWLLCLRVGVEAEHLREARLRTQQWETWRGACNLAASDDDNVGTGPAVALVATLQP